MTSKRFSWRILVVVVAAWLCVDSVNHAQEPVKPASEHALLKELDGTWDATMDFMGQKSKGSMVYKLMPGGLWLMSDFKGDMMGQAFYGHGVMGFDTQKKKYVSIWVDSMGASMMSMEGTYDAAKKLYSEAGEGPGPDGKMMKMRMTTEFKSKDELLFTMYMPDPSGKEQAMFTITYKRKK